MIRSFWGRAFPWVLVFFFLLWSGARARVHGPCANCHTMHNSQNGVALSASGPYQRLTNKDCVGCHSNDGSATIVTIGETRIPIVLNSAPPAYPSDGSSSGVLAGGNFYWVEHQGDEYGHNVINPDATLAWAPGGTSKFGVVPNSCGFEGCHKSLASIRYGPGPGPLFNPIRGNGCIGCHDAAHHANDEQYLLGNGYKFVDESGGGYRFINKAGARFWNIPPHNPPAVAGIEDPDWEQTVSPSDHNEYEDYPKPFAPLAYGGNPQGISDFCAGCHNAFHSWPEGGWPNGGDGNPWLRHPSGVVLPNRGEYANYTVYNPMAPVARADANALRGQGGPSAEVHPGQDKVMCLSCHRAHGSPYPDMLRWDYNTCEAGSGNDECGCFVCHTSKK